jgi:phospholipase/carboxylesterase
MSPSLRARRQTLGPLDCVVVDDETTTRRSPTLVLCHGFGAPGDDLVGLVQAVRLPPGTRAVFPAAPLELPVGYGDARAWWLIDVGRFERALSQGTLARELEDEPPGLEPARSALSACLDAVASELGDGPLVIGGFSQGAMITCDLALREARPLAGLVMLSGTMIAAKVWQARLASRKGLRVFMSHGQRDPLLPFVVASGLHEQLAQAGLDVTWVEHRGGHEIPMPVIEGLGRWLATTLR